MTLFTHSIEKKLSAVKSNIKCHVLIMHKWFHENHMVLSPGKCHSMLIRNKSHDDKVILNRLELETIYEGKLLGVLIDKNLEMDSRVG